MCPGLQRNNNHHFSVFGLSEMNNILVHYLCRDELLAGSVVRQGMMFCDSRITHKWNKYIYFIYIYILRICICVFCVFCFSLLQHYILLTLTYDNLPSDLFGLCRKTYTCPFDCDLGRLPYRSYQRFEKYFTYFNIRLMNADEKPCTRHDQAWILILFGV